MSRLLLMMGEAAPSTPPPPDPMDNYSDALPLSSAYAGTTTVSPGMDLYAKVEDAHAAAGLQRVLVEPGVYTARVVGYPDVHIIGTTGDPAEVIVQDAGSDTGGRWSPLNGTPGVAAGITWRLLSATVSGSGQYGMHLTATGLTIFEKCVFESQSPTRNDAIGADVSVDSDTYFIDCVLDQGTAVVSNSSMNMHSTATGAPSTVAFVNCDANGYVGYSDIGTNQADHFWFVEGTAAYWRGTGPNVTLHLGPGVGDQIAGPFTGTVIESDARPPMPYHGAL